MNLAQTTGFTSIMEGGKVLITGLEKYPIIGNDITEQEAERIIFSFKGLMKYWDCIKKAEITQDILGRGLCLGGSS